MAAGKTYPIQPKDVPQVETAWRRIATRIPAPDSVAVLEELRRYEPRSMSGQPPIVWDRAEGCQVHDAYGNTWLDWSSGVLVTNAGHCHPLIRKAIIEQAEHGLIHNYCFPSEQRARLSKALVEVAPEGVDKAFLLTTGAEATECAIKLSRARGVSNYGPQKNVIVTFTGAFHGRTLGAQQAGGIPALKEWIVNLDPGFVQAPFPDGFRCRDVGFDLFERSLNEQGVEPQNVAGIMMETYLGGGASFAPAEYVRAMREWACENDALLVMDEVQAGFGRTGTFWGFEHYGIVPDLICCGKGISSGMPLSAVLGRADVMDQFEPGSMTSTHSGNPVCVAAALASIEAVQTEGLVEKAARAGKVLHDGLRGVTKRFPRVVGALHGLGMVAGLHLTKEGSNEPDGELAHSVVQGCYERGLLMFAPVGLGGATLKICPPLVTPEEAVREGVSVLVDAMEAAMRT
jgi:4-aminobutyrate aminotransferase/(S)-3-amino-2-methylpropionate transaminase